jgi:hypothetical protein
LSPYNLTVVFLRTYGVELIIDSEFLRVETKNGFGFLLLQRDLAIHLRNVDVNGLFVLQKRLVHDAIAATANWLLS